MIKTLLKKSTNKIKVNGKTYNLPSGNISIINGEIYVNGGKI